MSQRKKVSRDDQRSARALMQQRRIPYMEALALVRDSEAPGVATSGARMVRGWLKSLHYRHDGWTIAPGEQGWVSDISRHDRHGDRVYRQDGTPWGEPSWTLGDLVGLYFGGTLRVPILVEVVSPPRFDPDFVQEHNDGGEPEAGDRWPWVTEVRGVLAVALDQAPSLEDIGVQHASLRQRSRLVLTQQQLSSLEQKLR